jgi:hypothetical protein
MGVCGGGSIGGAITGFLLGGPVGALAGALIGDAAIDKPQKLQEQSINNQKTLNWQRASKHRWINSIKHHKRPRTWARHPLLVKTP